MEPSKGYYSLIQYCPDLSRLEAANIGVLLFCPERNFLRAATSRNNKRIRGFFGSEGHDWERINSFKKGFEETLEVEAGCIQSLADLERFIATRANEFQLTAPRPLKVRDPEKELSHLFRELVGGPVRRGRRLNLRQYLSKAFNSAGIDDKVHRDIRVTIPVFMRQIKVPYGYQNGRLNLIQPVRFEGREPGQALTTACKYAVAGRSLYDHPDPSLGERQLVVVGKFRGQQEETRSAVERVLSENEVRLFALSDLTELIDEIRTTAKPVTGSGT